MSLGDTHFSETYEGHGLSDSSPFLPTFVNRYIAQDKPKKGNFDYYELTFNQAYIMDSAHSGDLLSRRGANARHEQVDGDSTFVDGGTNIFQNLVGTKRRNQGSRILNMDHPFEHKLREQDTETWPAVHYGVEVIYNLDNLMVKKATFTGVTGEANTTNGQFPFTGSYGYPIFAEDDNWNSYNYDGTLQGWVTGYFPVCKIVGNEVVDFTCRDNLHIGERQIKAERYDITGGADIVDRYKAALVAKVEDEDGEPFWGGTGQARLIMKHGWLDPENVTSQPQLMFKDDEGNDANVAKYDYKPIRWRGIIAGSGLSVSPYLDSIVIDATGAGGDGVPWSGENCGRGADPPNHDADWAVPQGFGAGKSKAKNVYKAYTAAQDGTHASPAIFRRLSGAGTVEVDYDDDRLTPNECLIRISGGIVEAPWSGENCGRVEPPDADNWDAAWARTQGINAAHSQAKNVYMAYQYPDGNDGTRDQPALFRRISGEAARDGSSYDITSPFTNGGVRVDYDTNDCLIFVSGHLWSGQNCVKDGTDDANYDGKAYNVYAGNWGEQDGIHQNPAHFRRLSGDGKVTVKYDTDDCLIQISGECCEVENAGTYPDSDGEGARVYQTDTSDPSMLRRVVGGGLLANIAGASMVKESSLITPADDNSIVFSGIWSGRNIGDYGEDIYLPNRADGTQDDGTQANPAQFRRLKGEKSVTVTSRDHYLEISGSEAMNTGLQRGDGGCDYGQKVYKEFPTPYNPFIFRTITGRYDTSDSSTWAENGGNQINVVSHVSDNLIRVVGNNKDGYLQLPETIFLNENGAGYGTYLLQTADEDDLSNKHRLTWKDGLISGLEKYTDNGAGGGTWSSESNFELTTANFTTE